MEYVALAISLLALTLAVSDLHAARTANTLPVLIDLMRDFRTDPVLNAGRAWIRSTPGTGRPDPATGYQHLPVEVVQLSWFFDHLGVLVHRGIVKHEPVAEYIGGSILQAWELLQPYIETERKRTEGWNHYQVYFQILAKRVGKDIHGLRSKALRAARS